MATTTTTPKPTQTPLNTTIKPPTGIDLYSRFALAGALGCGITHGLMTPVDVVKTRIQLSPEIYNKTSGKNRRCRCLIDRLWPTATGYFIQGALKFGGYEFWKKTFIDLIGVDKAREYRMPIYMLSSGIAEFFADVALCPLEATRIRLVSQPSFANGLVSGFSRLLKEEGVRRGFYSGFGPILFKQIPYTMAKFGFYEIAAEKIMQAINKPKEEISPTMLTVIDLNSGIIAGIAAALISQPADTLLSKINKEKGVPGQSVTSRLLTLTRQLGVKGLFLGTVPRVCMVSLLTAGQFVIYGDIKRALGASQGVEIAKIPKTN
ncbi:mitochondrial carrier domain-containing protein [Absidia repens]|uniref:Mitochondrial carrier domain-containing protein n=1 Tax=Absidia repens TaxID=90262 RepID=A0A1X2IGN1_9FUNG|nr:mitochondrial carrier domain-containing protein [Absidia repens]